MVGGALRGGVGELRNGMGWGIDYWLVLPGGGVGMVRALEWRCYCHSLTHRAQSSTRVWVSCYFYFYSLCYEVKVVNPNQGHTSHDPKDD